MVSSEHPSTILTTPVSIRDHVQGPITAPVTLIEYGDFQSLTCSQVFRILHQIRQEFGAQLRFVFRHFPLPQHEYATQAAEAAEAAAAQGWFWEMHDYLFERQYALDEEHLLMGVAVLSLDTAIFEEDLLNHVYAERVREDVESGIAGGVETAPTLFINGCRYEGEYDYATLQAAIAAAIPSKEEG
jgi:protein-disulfide isomerase